MATPSTTTVQSGRKRKVAEEESVVAIFQNRINHIELENQYLSVRLQALEEEIRASRLKIDDLCRDLRERTEQRDDLASRLKELNDDFIRKCKSHDIVVAKLRAARDAGKLPAEHSLPGL